MLLIFLSVRASDGESVDSRVRSGRRSDGLDGFGKDDVLVAVDADEDAGEGATVGDFKAVDFVKRLAETCERGEIGRMMG